MDVYLKQPLFGYLWELRLPVDMDPGGAAARQAITVDWPGLSVDVEPNVPYLPNFTVGLPMGWAGGNVITVTFVETEDGVVGDMLARWMEKMWKDNSELRPPKHYWRDLELVLLTADQTPALHLTATHAFPTAFHKITADYGTNDVVRIEVPFHYADVKSRR